MTTALLKIKDIEAGLTTILPSFSQLVRGLGVPPERIMRTVVIACDRTPKLRECTMDSILQAATTGAVLGLEADGVSGQGFLIPFSIKNVLKAQWLTGYRGYNTLGARAGLTITGDVVRDGDKEWHFAKGTNAYVHHVPLLGREKERRIIAAWAVATALGRPPIVEVMSLDELLEIKERARGAGKTDSPWKQGGIPYAAMCGKTAKRRLARSTPLSAFLLAARVDEAHEEMGRHAYLRPDQGIVIDGKAETVAAPAQVEAPKVGAPQPQPERPLQLGLAPDRFLLQWGKAQATKRYCANIEEWRSKAIILMNSLKPDDPLEAKKKRRRPLGVDDKLEIFEQFMGPIFDDLSQDFAKDVKAVVDHLDKKLGRGRP